MRPGSIPCKGSGKIGAGHGLPAPGLGDVTRHAPVILPLRGSFSHQGHGEKINNASPSEDAKGVPVFSAAEPRGMWSMRGARKGVQREKEVWSKQDGLVQFPSFPAGRVSYAGGEQREEQEVEALMLSTRSNSYRNGRVASKGSSLT